MKINISMTFAVLATATSAPKHPTHEKHGRTLRYLARN